MICMSYDMYLVRNGMPECDGKGRPVFDPKCIENLKHIIAAIGADIVVTSDWKYIDSYEDLFGDVATEGNARFYDRHNTKCQQPQRCRDSTLAELDKMMLLLRSIILS